MYVGVPAPTVCCSGCSFPCWPPRTSPPTRGASEWAVDRPKSPIFTTSSLHAPPPACVTKRFAGLTSRCMSPWLCTSFSPRITCLGFSLGFSLRYSLGLVVRPRITWMKSEVAESALSLWRARIRSNVTNLFRV